MALIMLIGCNSDPETPSPDVQQFSLELETYHDFLQLPGLAVGVAQDDSLIYFKGMGFANVQTSNTNN